MEPGKSRKFKTRLRQRLSYKLLLATGVSAALITAVLVIYFQFFQNEVTKAKTLPVQAGGPLPTEMIVAERLIVNTDTLSMKGNRYKIAKPLKR